MNTYNRFAIVILLISMAIMGNCFASDDDILKDDFGMDDFHDFNFEDEIEAAVGVPAIPDDSAFVLMPLDHAPPGMEVYIDISGMVRDKNNSSLHFWTLLKGAQGGYNLSFEGYRCSAHMFKVHGWGTRGRTPEFRANKNAEWQKVYRTAGSGYRRELDDFYLCRDGLPNSRKQILDNVENKSITDDDADT